MNGNEFLDKMGLVDPKFIEESEKVRRKRKISFIKMLLPAAACFVFLVCLGIFDIQNTPSIPEENASSGNAIISSGGNSSSCLSSDAEEPDYNENEPVIVKGVFEERREKYYRDITFNSGGDLAYVWPYQYQTDGEFYSTLILEEREYTSTWNIFNDMDTDLLGELLCYQKIFGYDEITDETPYRFFPVHSVKNVSTDVAVAVQMDGKYYVFRPSEYNPPENLGEFLKTYNLPENLTLDRFSELEGYTDKRRHGLNDDSFIWEVLLSCSEAEFIPDDLGSFTMADREYLSFAVNSEALGIYNRVFYITKDGYIRTNAFNYAYTFFIGEEAANKIIDYAMANKTEPPKDVKYESIFGVITKVTEDYFLLEDSQFCENPKNGTVFKVMMNDMRIRRYFLCDIFSEGSTVRVNFTEGIDIANENKIIGAYDIGYASVIEGEEETNPAIG